MQISATVFILVLVLGHREEVSGATIADRLSPMALIIGGTDVEDGKAPYLAGLVYNNSETYCGGSIIAARWILTAARCVTNVNVTNLTVVRVGTNDIYEGGSMYQIDRVIPHERYSAITIRNDVALLRLKTPIKFEEHVEKIELNEELVPINATLTIVGWGFVGWNKENPKRTQGDSGSPVVWKGKQVGVVSWAMAGVCAIGLPDVQASIRYFYGWITKTMAANSDH
uniref:trypsin n=1 Tax=Anopheles arabiensis TaxID=7173 RepID=A0A182HNZ8_ANOAR